MTDAQKGGKFNGFYKDDEDTEFEWSCAPPKAEVKEEVKEEVVNPYSNKDNLWFEIMLWITHASGFFWLAGYPILVPVGFFYTTWL